MDNSQINQISNDDPMIGKLIFDRYKLIKKLGAGSFGSLYSAENGNQYYAIKLEEKSSGQHLLENEAYIMSYLHGPGLPVVKSFGYNRKYYILVMELMGKSLEDIFKSFVVKKMSPRCVCNIGYQMIEILEYIHNKHVIHRDIKPDNFVIGKNYKKKYIYILDFGLYKKYRSSKTLKHYQMVKNKNLTGTARYASINALNGLSQSRRDDLESVGYVLMYFLRGKLPWQGIPAKNKEERYRKIMEKKLATSPEELCMGYPPQFAEYIKYTRLLEYEQNPDYNYLRNLFISVLNSEGCKIDCYYDWDKETINYFRDFKNVDNNNKGKNDYNTINSIHKFNTKETYSNVSKENKIHYSGRLNTHNNIHNSNSKLQRNSNNMSFINIQGNKLNGISDSRIINEGSSYPQKQNEKNGLKGNKRVNHNNKEKYNFIQNKVNNNKINYNDDFSNIRESNQLNKIIESKNLNHQNINGKNNNEQRKLGGMNPRQEKEDKCCLIF